MQEPKVQWINNWKHACRGVNEWRRELKRDGDIAVYITSYLFAPLFWVIVAIMVTYFTLKSPNV